MRLHTALAAALLAAACTRPAAAPTAIADAELTRPRTPLRPPLMDGVGATHRPITTDEALAQRYFDQGIALLWGFNHDEATASFREAIRLDPACAMCWWGSALALGPKLDARMAPADLPMAREAAQEAMLQAAGGTACEQALIDALARRYGAGEREELDHAWAEAIGAVAARFPEDPDAAVLHAEALLLLHPEAPWTTEIPGILRGVLAANPDHLGANHLLVRALEGSPRPEEALLAAERLPALAPAVGAVVHAPAPLLARLGRYHEASAANQRAIEADRAWRPQATAVGRYVLEEMPHAAQSLQATATLEGRGALALEAAQLAAELAEPARLDEPRWASLQHYAASPLFALVRFGRWGEILNHSPPPAEQSYVRAVWFWARGMASSARGELDDAEMALLEVRRFASDPRLDRHRFRGGNRLGDLTEIAYVVLSGELAAARGDVDIAITYLKRGAALEDALIVREPPDWPQPVRLQLGAALLEADRPEDAEAAFRQDLQRHPENGWALAGLVRALDAQRKTREADEVRTRLAEAWQHADPELMAGR